MPGGTRKLVRGRRGKRQTTAKEAAPCVSGSYAKQRVNPPRSYGSVGIPVPLGRGGCQCQLLAHLLDIYDIGRYISLAIEV
ncbi:MAG: hypothetical protein F6K39_25175 [Okeania sp. SIO3B3]|nr:hypothetical protein [Okeania sp. SIO3B3]